MSGAAVCHLGTKEIQRPAKQSWVSKINFRAEDSETKQGHREQIWLQDGKVRSVIKQKSVGFWQHNSQKLQV